jgi:ribose 5-phosphate isomerase A
LVNFKARRVSKKRLNIKGVPTSKNTEKLAIESGIQLVCLSSINHLDLTIDGADEANKNFELIKGGGGALLREKMVASISKRFIIVIDETKYVTNLGQFPLPVEIVQFG